MAVYSVKTRSRDPPAELALAKMHQEAAEHKAKQKAEFASFDNVSDASAGAKVAHATAELAAVNEKMAAAVGTDAGSSARVGPAMVSARPGMVKKAPAGDKYKDMRGYEVRLSLLHGACTICIAC